jgi:hypothetical protein
MIVTMSLYGTRNHLPHFLTGDMRHLEDAMTKSSNDCYYQFVIQTSDDPLASMIALVEKDHPPQKLTVCSDGDAVGPLDFRCMKASKASIRHLDSGLDSTLSETFKPHDAITKEFLTRAHALAKELPDLSEVTSHTAVTLETVEAILVWLAFDWKTLDKTERASFATAMQTFKQNMTGGEEDNDEDNYADDGEDSEEEREEDARTAAASTRPAPKILNGKGSDAPSSKKMRLGC